MKKIQSYKSLIRITNRCFLTDVCVWNWKFERTLSGLTSAVSFGCNIASTSLGLIHQTSRKTFTHTPSIIWVWAPVSEFDNFFTWIYRVVYVLIDTKFEIIVNLCWIFWFVEKCSFSHSELAIVVFVTILLVSCKYILILMYCFEWWSSIF